MAKVRDVTDEVLRDSSSSPYRSPNVDRVVKAKPAHDVTPTLAETLAAWERMPDRSFGRVSKALAYSRAMPRQAREHSNTIRLIKGGHLRVCEVSAPPPDGSVAKRDTPYADRYYLIRLGHCGDEVPEGTLAGRVRKRHRR